MDPAEDLEGLQWGKSGLEMDEERKKQVCHENLKTKNRKEFIHEYNPFMSH